MYKKYNMPILAGVVLLTALMELNMGNKGIEQKSMIMDTFLTNDIALENEDITFNTNEQPANDIIGEYSFVNDSYVKTSNVEDSNSTISTEKIADPSQRYREVDEYYYVNQNIPIYTEDNENSEQLKQAEYGDYIHKIGNDPYNSDGFSKVEIDGREGYINTQSLTTEILFKERNQNVYAKENIAVYQELELKTQIDSVEYIHEIKMIGESHDLVKVVVNDKTGYVEKSKISKDMIFIDNQKTVWTLSDIDLKSTPDSSSDTVKTAYKYDSFQQLGTSQEWSKLQMSNGNIVYVKTSALTDVRPISKGEEIANYALQFVGNPYVYGGTSLTNGTDCSGFTQSIYKHFGYSLNRTSSAQMSNGRAVSYSDARPGDLIFYSGHVAMYIGNGQIVHASNSAPYPQGGIKISPATYTTIIGVRRIVD